MNKPSDTSIKQLGTILTIWAHPDDESFNAAGIMALAVQNGQKVVCVTATTGEKGVQDAKRWPPERLGQVRAAELRNALDILGVKQQHWLGYMDGSCKQIPTEEAAEKLKVYIDQYKPDTILTFGPDGLTGHEDHCAVSGWVDEAVKSSDVAVYHVVQINEIYEEAKQADKEFNIFFNIEKPPLAAEEECDLLLHLPKGLLNKKYRCLSAMPSQYEAMFNKMGRDAIRRMIRTEAFVRAK